MKYRNIKGYKYVLAERVEVSCPELAQAPNFSMDMAKLVDGSVSVAPLYPWDGASGPTWDTPSTMKASLIHDVLYQALRLGHLPKKFKDPADRVLQRLMIDHNPSKLNTFRAGYYYRAVKWFGGFTMWRSARKPEQYTVIHTIQQ